MPHPRPALNRRQFLAAGALGAAGPLQALLARAPRAPAAAATGYGPLEAVRDETTGLPLLKLPRGFRYATFGWRGDPLEDGALTPSLHDGMAAFARPGGRVALVRNHEQGGDRGAIGTGAYDPAAEGGTTTIEFDPRTMQAGRGRISLAGTLRNCAGGPTPWGTWLTCEETLLEPARGSRLRKPHGYVFEVPLDRPAPAIPLVAMGRFVHEAVAIDRETGIVYETEDHGAAGFYRFVPAHRGVLSKGGRLEMLAVDGRRRFDTRSGQRVGQEYGVHWVPIAEPDRPHSPSGPDAHGVHDQGAALGGTTFARLEGAWAGGGRIYFNATAGGDAGKGQVWEYTPATETLRLIFESPSGDLLNHPDNLCVSPRGGLALCEDGDDVQRLRGLTRDGRIFPFVENAVVLRGEKNGLSGDFRTGEFAGSCYSPDGEWLFFNLQQPGFTVALTGPWGQGRL